MYIYVHKRYLWKPITITKKKKKKIVLRVREIHLLQITFLISTDGDLVPQNEISIVGD